MFTKSALLAARIHIALLAAFVSLLVAVFLPQHAFVIIAVIVSAAVLLGVQLPFLCRHIVIYLKSELLCICSGVLFAKTYAYPLHLCSFLFVTTPLLAKLDLVIIIVRISTHRIVLPYLPASAKEQLLNSVSQRP